MELKELSNSENPIIGVDKSSERNALEYIPQGPDSQQSIGDIPKDPEKLNSKMLI